jgi:hypothetical protein
MFAALQDAGARPHLIPDAGTESYYDDSAVRTLSVSRSVCTTLRWCSPTDSVTSDAGLMAVHPPAPLC